MTNPDSLVVTQALIPVQMPVFTCNLSPFQGALQLAREAIDDLRAQNPVPMDSNVKSIYVSPWNSHFLTEKFNPLCELVLTVSRHVTQVFLSANLESLGLDYWIKDCWGMIYEKSDHTLPHNHFPSELSCAIYLEAAPDCAPIVFDNNFTVQPENGLLVLFPGIMMHSVPSTPGRRVVVSMNVFKKARGL